MKKNILIISIYYPPIQSIASNRIYSFAKYLDKEKYNIYIHTIEEGREYNNDLSDVKISRVKNESMFKPVTFDKRTSKYIHYCKVVYNILIKKFTKDIYGSWVSESIKMLLEIVEREKIDIVISSFAPIASHRVALHLKKKYPHLKWIADMRDEMSASPYIDTKTKIIYQEMEKAVFENASALTTVSKPILEEFRTLSKGSELLFCEIRNGYDFEIDKRYKKNSQFIVSYVGNFYGDINPNNFFIALSELVNENKIDNFQVNIIGDKTHFEIPKNLKENVVIKNSMLHADAVEEMKSSDILLLVHPNNGRKGVFTGKIFEYLATLNPIIALVDINDVAAKLIKDCNAGYVSQFDNIDDIKRSIIEAFTNWKDGVERDIDINLIKKHHRREQAKRLEILIEELVDE